MARDSVNMEHWNYLGNNVRLINVSIKIREYENLPWPAQTAQSTYFYPNQNSNLCQHMLDTECATSNYVGKSSK